jgi:hypothetical protein
LKRYGLFEGDRMVATHATKAGMRYRYYVSQPGLHGEDERPNLDPSSGFLRPALSRRSSPPCKRISPRTSSRGTQRRADQV